MFKGTKGFVVSDFGSRVAARARLARDAQKRPCLDGVGRPNGETVHRRRVKMRTRYRRVDGPGRDPSQRLVDGGLFQGKGDRGTDLFDQAWDVVGIITVGEHAEATRKANRKVTRQLETIQRKEEEVTIHPVYLGGGFGRKIDERAAVEAARHRTSTKPDVRRRLARPAKEGQRPGWLRHGRGRRRPCA